MSGHQTGTINDTIYFWFAANDTSGSGGDGATPLYDVREAGAAADAIPLLSGTPTLLSHANYPAGCHEIAIAATTGNGFAADDTFAVFCTLAVDSQNPTGFVGSCTLTPLAKVAALATAQTDLDKLTGSDGATLATAQANYAPSKAGDSMDLVANAVDSTSVATAAFTATKFAADWLDAAGLKTDAVTEIVAGMWNALMASYQVDGSFGLAANEIDAGTAQAGSAGTITLDAGSASTTADLMNGAIVKTVGGTGAGQSRRITDYAVTSRIASIEPNWITNPGADTKYVVVPGGNADLRTASQSTLDGIQTDLDNGTDGLGALKALIDTVNSDLANGTDGLGALKALIDTVNSDLANGTDGLGALKALIDTVTTDVGTVNTDLSNATDGLGALKTLVDAVQAAVDALQDISSANVLTQVNAALDTAIAELGVAAPTATPTFRTALMFVYMAILQKRDTTATSDEIHNAAGTAIASASVSDDGVTFSKAKYT